MGFLSGIKDESVILQQGQRIGNQLIQVRIAEPNRWLYLSWGLLLAQDAGDVIGAECAGSGSFGDCVGHRLGTVLADQIQQFR
ncbi:MAG TPA: hypothetical protein VKV17_10670 [Bryobacteraceae bacterium]|nr:hypothetical protein [Bryobacteraceae bacterium]